MALNFKRSLDTALGQAKLVKGMSARMEAWFLSSVKNAEVECETDPSGILNAFTRQNESSHVALYRIVYATLSHANNRMPSIKRCSNSSRLRQCRCQHRNRLRNSQWRMPRKNRKKEKSDQLQHRMLSRQCPQRISHPTRQSPPSSTYTTSII